MNIRNNYNHTIASGCIGYFTQSVIINFLPLLFVTLQKEYQISLDKISLLISINFGVQILVDLASVKFIDRYGMRNCGIAAHIFSAAGLFGLYLFPLVISDMFIALLLSVAIYAVGGGLLEVIVSPVVEACPTTDKGGIMSMLHSFYCWGHVCVVAFSTLFFGIFGVEKWRILAVIWSLVPFLNIFYFRLVPINVLVDDNEKIPLKKLIKNKAFLVFVMIMLCSGASEQGMAQWVSAFAEKGLGVSKTIGDLVGPCLFALLMGISRFLYSKLSGKVNLNLYMLLSGALCIVSYLLSSLSDNSTVGFIGTALCGVAVGIMWPGTLSLASEKIRGGGTALFSLLALSGDIGCTAGPAVVGVISEHFDGNLKNGMLCAIVFPVVLIIGLIISNKMSKVGKENA